jgi:uncharacterized protein YbjT (DUF2867 family)
LLAGGTGTVGREVAKGLVARGLVPRVLSRDPENARKLLGTGVEVVRGDFMDAASLSRALSGVEVAYLATTPTPELATQELNFIAAAQAAKVRRLVKMSGYGMELADDPVHHCHTVSEQRLRSSGLEHVILQPVMFMTNLLWEAGSIRQGKLASAFGHGRMSFVDPLDVADIALVALTTREPVSGGWGFGGPEALSYDDVASTFSRVLGHRVEHVRLDVQRFKQAAEHLPDFVIEAIVASAALAQKGTYEVLDGLIRDKLGRRARSLESWVASNRAAFTGAIAS